MEERRGEKRGRVPSTEETGELELGVNGLKQLK